MSRRLPSLTPRQVIATLQRAGFVVTNTTGSHYRLRHGSDPDRFTVVPFHNREMKRGLLLAIVKQAGFTVEEFIDLL